MGGGKRPANGAVNVRTSTGAEFSAKDDGAVPTNWFLRSPTHTGGDGGADIVWRNANGGALAVWTAAGSGFVPQDCRVVDPGRRIVS